MKFAKIVDAALIGGAAIAAYMVLYENYDWGGLASVGAGVAMGVVVACVLAATE